MHRNAVAVPAKKGPEERVDPVPVRHHKGNFFRRHGDGCCTGRLPKKTGYLPDSTVQGDIAAGWRRLVPRLGLLMCAEGESNCGRL